MGAIGIVIAIVVGLMLVLLCILGTWKKVLRQNRLL